MFENFESKYNIKYILKDSVLISYPKSGRTWLRMIMAKIAHLKGFDVTKEEFMPALHYDVDKVKNIFGDDLKIVFLHRDIADVLSSYYAEKSTSTRSGSLYTGKVNEFIKDKNHGVDAAIHYNKKWLELAKNNKNIKVVSYEQLKKDAFSSVSDIMRFLGFECTTEEISEAVEYSRFENMSKIEKGLGDNLLENYKGNFGKSVGRVRRGIVGGHKKDFSDEDISYIASRKKALKYDV